MRKILTFSILMILGFSMIGCGKEEERMDVTYKTISMQEAVELMEQENDYIILDVRTVEEYESGHIPGAICVQNEEIGSESIPELPDKEKLIMVYCRSGNRSKQAAEKLAKIGYSNIVEFGGIRDWKGEITK